MRVKGPNGLVLDLPTDVVEGLLKSEDYELVKDEPKPEKKPAAKKSPAPKK